MKNKIFLILFHLFFTFTLVVSQERTTSQDSIKHHVSIGLNTGIGLNINGYKLSPDESTGFSYYGVNPHYSFGVDLGFRLAKKYRLRFEYRFQKMQYGMKWGENYPDFDHTVTSISESGFSCHLDYLTFATKKIQVFISPGILYELVVKDSYENTMSDGDVNSKYYSVLNKQYPKDILGGNLSAIVKYKLNNSIGITLTPSYTCFFHKFLESNDKPYQRLSLNLGVEFSFF
jgi:hypothetical protein